MSGPYHERAVCECGWSNECAFGDLAHLTSRGRFINYCPDCGENKHKMEIMLLRFHNGTWRTKDGTPYDGKEPTPTELKRAQWQPIGCIIACLVIITICLYLLRAHL